MTLEQAIFPAGYRVGDHVVACCLASIRCTGSFEESETVNAAFMSHLEALEAKHPEIPLPAIFGNAYEITRHDYRAQQHEWLGEPLRAAWFELTYECWVLVAMESGLIQAEKSKLDAALVHMVDVLVELGIEATADACLGEIHRFRPTSLDQRRAKFSDRRAVTFAATTVVKAMHYAHLAALRHRRSVTLGFIETGVLIASDDPKGNPQRDIASYLTAHGIFAYHDSAAAQRDDHMLVLVGEAAMGVPDFWRLVEAGLDLGLHPLVVTMLPRHEIGGLAPKVPAAHAAAFAKLLESTVVELSSEVSRFVPLLRALDSVDPRLWWWRDDAIDIATAIDIFNVFNRSGPAARGTGRITGHSYPFRSVAADIARGLELAGLLTDTQIGEVSLAAYEAAADALVPLRINFPDGHFRLPWFAMAFWTHLLLTARDNGSDLPANIQERAEREMQLSLFSLGMGTSPGDVGRMLGAVADLPWPGPVSGQAAVGHRANAFFALVRHLGDAAVARGQRVGLKFPLRYAFLSYARSDEAIVKRLVTFVEAKNVADIWWDMNSITLGSVLNDTLRSAVEKAELLLLVVSPASIASRYVRLELDCALAAGLEVIPVLIGDEPLGDVPAAFDRNKHAAAFRPSLRLNPADEEDRFREVAAALVRDPTTLVQWLAALPGWSDAAVNTPPFSN